MMIREIYPQLVLLFNSLSKKTAMIISFLVIGFQIHAQVATNPVQVNSNLVPPYSLYLSDYSASTLNKWNVQLLLRDFTQTDYQAKLRVTIEGAGIRLRTKPGYSSSIITLNPGIPYQVDASTLADYLNLQNLDVSGISRNKLANDQKLPEGFYTFSVEVLDFQRNNVVSNKGTAMAWIVLNDPPLLNLPIEEKLRVQEPQQIQFQWTPRHTASPNSAFETEYVFRLWEIWPADRNPNEVVRTSQPIVEQQVMTTSYFYGPADIPLIPGRSYAWQVQAVNLTGRDLFKNEGRSEVKSFQYGDACMPITNLGAEALGPDRIRVSWETEWNHTNFVVQIRKKGTTEWTNYGANIEKQVIYDLQANAEYEIQVQPICGVVPGVAEKSLTLRTLEQDVQDFDCGAEPEIPAIENRELIASLSPGDRIKAAGFTVLITEVTASGDAYTGKGSIEVPLFNLAKVEAELKNIKVNTDFQLIGGFVESIVNPDGPFIVGLDGSDETPAEGEEADETEDGGEASDSTNTESPDIDIEIDADIDSVYTNDDGDIVVVDAHGDEQILSDEEASDTDGDGIIVLEDENGDTWTVDENGDVTSGGTSSEGGGSTDTEDSDSEEQEDIVLPDNALLFGPIQVTFADSLRSSGQDEEGYCIFDSLAASFQIQLVDDAIEISKEVNVEGGFVSFKKQCSGDAYKEVRVYWNNDQGLDIGSVGFMGAKLYSIDLTINASGEVTGAVDLEPYLEEDKQFSNLVVVRKGVAGRFGFNFSGVDSFDGDFDFTSVTGINIDLVKDNEVFASLANGSFNDQKQVEGTVRLGGDPFSYASNSFSVKLNSFEANIKIDPGEHVYFSEGSGEVEISDIEGVSGKLTAGLEMSENQWITSVKSSTLSGYGLTFKNLNISSVINPDLSIEKINGSLKASHPSLNTDLSINSFLIEQGELKEFNASGNFEYDGFSIDLASSEYIPDSTALLLNATARVESDGVAVAANIENFYIDSEGNISLGNVDISIDGTVTFGPVSVALQSEAEKQGNASGSGYKRYTANASMYLKVKDDKGFEKEQPLADISIGFDKHKNKSEYRNINILLTDDDGIDFGNLYGLQTSLNEVKIDVGPKSGVEFLTGTSSDAENIAISDESYVKLSAAVTEDQTIKDVFVLKAGAGGDITYSFAGGTTLDGNFNFSDVSNINLFIQKGDQQLASLTNGSLNSEGVLSGTLNAMDNASFTTNSFDVLVNELTVDFEYPIAEGIDGFAINSGTGNLSIQNINGVEGNVNLSVDYGIDGNFNASVNNENTTLNAFTMAITDFNVSVEMDQSFSITKITGAASAKHSSFDTKLTISQFEVENGVLIKFKGEGDVSYKGFDLEILETSYLNNELSITGKMNLDLTGASVKAEIREFKVRENGSIVVKQVSSNLNKPPLQIGFSAGFDENRFHGTFNGSMLSVGLNGELDIGKQTDYYFAYLMLTAKTDVPLGPSGLKLTQFGGQLGYNYTLDYNANERKFVGNPLNNKYLIGLKLGVADVANMVEVTGNPIVQFGDSEVDISLIGTVKAPRYNPVFTGELNANYTMPSHVVSGSLSTDLKIPATSGKVFNGNFAIDFYAGNGDWSVNSSNISASILEEINFTGSVDIEGEFQSNSFTGTLQGGAAYDYRKEYRFEAFGADLYARFNAGFNFNGQISVLESGFSGNLNVRIYANGALGVETTLYDGEISVDGDCDAEVSYANNQGRLRGTLHTTVDLTFFEKTVDINVDQTF